MSLKLGPRGEALIKSYEKLRLKAFKPTPDDPWTIGWGHTRGVKEGDTCTPEQAEKWFLEDTGFALRTVDLTRFYTSTPKNFTQSMIDALTSLIYNVGASAVAEDSTIGKALAKEDYFGAWRGFALWIIEGGMPSLGLARRRSREMALFFEDGLPSATAA